MNLNSNKLACCKPIYNFQQSGLSRKMIISKMIQSGKSIDYANSQSASIYITILTLDPESNKNLLLQFKYKLYMKFLNKLISCGKYNSHEIYSMIENILANLTPDEYNIVYDIKPSVPPPNIISPVISKIFYISVDINNKFFLIKNYNGEYILPNKSYEFNLEDPTNLNTQFSLSKDTSGNPIEGLVYNGIPGTPGSNVILTLGENSYTSYNLYVYNGLTKNYSWGYSQPVLHLSTLPNIYSSESYVHLPLQSYSFLSTYYYNSLKFSIQNQIIPFDTNANYKYTFYYGTYYINVAKIYSLALLNKGQENKIQYSGDIKKSTRLDVYGTINDGTYNFYYDRLVISVYEQFTPISIYSNRYGYLGAINIITFDSDASVYAKPEIRTDHPIDSNGIETLYGQTRVNVDYSNNRITMNNDIDLTSTSTSYGVYNGTYIFYSKIPITFLNKGKENIFIISGLNGMKGIGPDGITNYIFYSGVIQVKILGNFNKMSIYTYKGYCGGFYILNYNEIYNTYLPHSYAFTNINNLVLNDPPDIVYSTYINLNQTTKLFTHSYGNSSNTYNVITKDASNNIIFNDIPFSSTTQYRMKIGTYIFFNMSNLFLTFMTNNKPVTNDFYNGGFYFTTNKSPNGDSYPFNKGYNTYVNGTINYLNPITLTVTGDFVCLSICSTNGYNGGQNLISYSS